MRSKRRQLKSKRRQPLVKRATYIFILVEMATRIGQNGEEFWLKWRQSLVKTATVVSQNGDSSQSTFCAHAFIIIHMIYIYAAIHNCSMDYHYRMTN